MGWVSSHPQDTGVMQIPSLLFWANFIPSIEITHFKKSVVTSTLPKPMVDSQFSFNMTYWQHATLGWPVACIWNALYLVPRTPCTPLSAFLPAVLLTLLCELFLITSVSSAQKFSLILGSLHIIISSLSQQFSNMLSLRTLLHFKINKNSKMFLSTERHDTYR